MDYTASYFCIFSYQNCESFERLMYNYHAAALGIQAAALRFL